MCWRTRRVAEVGLTLTRRCWWSQTSDVSPTQLRRRTSCDVNNISVSESGDVTSTIWLATHRHRNRLHTSADTNQTEYRSLLIYQSIQNYVIIVHIPSLHYNVNSQKMLAGQHLAPMSQALEPLSSQFMVATKQCCVTPSATSNCLRYTY